MAPIAMIFHMRLSFATQMRAGSVRACKHVRMFSFVEIPLGRGQFPHPDI